MGEARTCPVCNAKFAQKNPRQVYCSSECRVRHNGLVRKRRYAEDAAYRERVREDRRRWGMEHGENMGSWNSVERTRLYAGQAAAALDDEDAELLRLLLSNGNGYERKRLVRWFERPSLGSVLEEIKSGEE